MSMAPFATITADLQEPVAAITLNRPDARNAMSHQMVAELLGVFTTLRDDVAYAGVRVVILRGAGASFCAGGDVRDLAGGASPEQERAAVARLDELLRAVNEAPQVVIARVQGHALGGGLGLVCVADIVVAGYSASFGLPEARLGLVPAVIAPYVVQRLGLTCARRLMLTGGQLTSKRARRHGLVQEVCADLELDSRVEAVTGEVLLCGPQALRECKQLLFKVLREAEGPLPPESATLEYRVDLLNRLRTSEEARQGMAAFLARQPSPWAPKPSQENAQGGHGGQQRG
jgi:isohexenylglutaconyl-CoA hydratase